MIVESYLCPQHTSWLIYRLTSENHICCLKDRFCVKIGTKSICGIDLPAFVCPFLLSYPGLAPVRRENIESHFSLSPKFRYFSCLSWAKAKLRKKQADVAWSVEQEKPWRAFELLVMDLCHTAFGRPLRSPAVQLTLRRTWISSWAKCYNVWRKTIT